jgi:regulator of sirC expression with transglutaminase-like and TPR domain
VESQLDALSSRVRKRVSSSRPSAILAHLHRVLFDEDGFAGNPGDYYNARNSYLPCVLESKRGIPITLVLIYKCVAEGVGLSVAGINAPGHFLAEVEMDGRPTLVDPFYGGRVLSREEAVKQIEGTTGRPASPISGDSMRVDHTDPLFKPATHREWIARLIRNLRGVYADTGRKNDVEAMGELFELL